MGTSASFFKAASSSRVRKPDQRVHPEPPGPRLGPVFGVSLATLREMGQLSSGVPQVLRDMVEFLDENGLQQRGLFRLSGSAVKTGLLRARCDSGATVDLSTDGGIQTVASLLKLFLRELPLAVIPGPQHAEMVLAFRGYTEEMSLNHMLKETLSSLPDDHYSVLSYLCHFLGKVASHSPTNHMSVENLATVFGPCLFHMLEEQTLCNRLVCHLLKNRSLLLGGGLDTPSPPPMLASPLGPEEEAKDLIITQPHVCESAWGAELRGTAATQLPGIAEIQVPGEETQVPGEEETQLPGTALTQQTAEMKVTGAEDTQAPGTEETQVPGTEETQVKVAEETQVKGAEEAQVPGTEETQVKVAEETQVKVAEETQVKVAEETQVPGAEETQVTGTAEMKVTGAEGTQLPATAVTQVTEAEETQVTGAEETQVTGTAEMQLPEEEEEQVPCSAETLHLALPPSQLASPSDETNRLRLSPASILEQNDIGSLTDAAPHFETATVESPGQDPPLQPEIENSCSGLIADQQDYRRDGDSMAELTDFQEAGATALPDSPHRDRVEHILTEDKETFQESDKLDNPEVEACPPSAPSWDHSGQAPGGPPSPGGEWGEKTPLETGPEPGRDGEVCEAPGPGQLLLLLIAESDSPLPSPRCPSLSQSQRFHSDPEAAPSPPCSQPFIKARPIARAELPEGSTDTPSVTLLRKHIQTLKRRIRGFEDRFEQERKCRPSQDDKAADPEAFQLMSELAKTRKQLRGLRAKQPGARKRKEHSETCRRGGDQQGETEPRQKHSLEETVEALLMRLREKRQALGLPDNMKEMTQRQMALEKITLQKCLLYFESLHGRPGTRLERSLMKPLYDRYRAVKQLLCAAPSITTIVEVEENRSDEGRVQRTSPRSSRATRPFPRGKSPCAQEEDDEPTFASPLDEVTAVGPLSITAANLHEASRSELQEGLRDARAEKRRLRKRLREFEDQFFRRMGRNIQKDDRIPMAEEYQEYKNLKAKVGLLEALLSKLEAPKSKRKGSFERATEEN